MPVDVGKSDLRIVKTAKGLNLAMFALLERHNFGKITVRDICDEAQISRATFYARFADKYDFLNSWLLSFKPKETMQDATNEKNEKIFNDYIIKNKAIIKNLICDADDETLKILSGFTLSIFDLPSEYDFRQMNAGQIVIFNFYAGGLISYFQWLAKNKFPTEIPPINVHLRVITKKFLEWAEGAV